MLAKIPLQGYFNFFEETVSSKRDHSFSKSIKRLPVCKDIVTEKNESFKKPRY